MRSEQPNSLLEPGELGVGIRAELLIVLSNVPAPDFLQVIHRRMQPHRAGDVRRARLKLVRGVLPGAPLEFHVEDHFSATLIRRHALQYLLAAVQHADARRSAHLVAGKSKKVTADLLNIDY